MEETNEKKNESVSQDIRNYLMSMILERQEQEKEIIIKSAQ